jgi:glucose-6-phosphate 1-dehydrogenase
VTPPVHPNDIAGRTVRGQYNDGFVAGQPARAYRSEKDVDPISRTDTYAALKLEIANWRWSGVPFYIRTGKRMARRVTEIAIEFKRVPHMLFKEQTASDMTPNVLTIRIQPDEGITLRFAAKIPGAANNLRPVRMDFQYGSSFGQAGPDAYERLLFDAMIGDPSLFARRDEVETAWGIVQPILDNWSNNLENPAMYDAGTWGPYEADMLLARDGRTWRRP